MNIQTYFFICLVIAAIGIILAVVNIATAVHRTFRTGETKGVIGLHLLAMLLYLGGGVGVIGFGIAWIIQAIKA